MTVVETSLEAYEFVHSPSYLNLRRAQILLCFKYFPKLCNHQIKRLTGLDINCVTPRTNELKNDFGVLRIVSKEKYFNPEKGSLRTVEYMSVVPGFDFSGVEKYLGVKL